MRTFNGLQIFTQQLTNSGQLDLRYVRISGNDQPANIYFGNLSQDFDFHRNTNFNINKSINIFVSDQNNSNFTGFLPDVTNGKLITIKNHSTSDLPLYISGYSDKQIFERSDEYLEIYQKHGVSLLGIKNNFYTGWVSMSFTQGIS